ncbi:hypothetical protein JN01_0604 [Entomoplasma freundtii]|uniref:Uncharacterized protein n=1 Tax=Entomoplasma freundtii TaxID=74700 RepID=A0A2K8NR80_9MOLU|nr:hypothetical protein [Entomoplasma freundtii]ATZ16355.1 hypothetical protein EFREU_v1c03290 [Entomoplasma freundtii]TDY56606.1 hypothetical protein JN01_0604 [Entomoplasma freundtii]
MLLTKQSTLKDLTNEVVLKWFKEIINERIKQLRTELQQLMNQMPMLGQFGNVNAEMGQSIDQIKIETGYLKNIGEIKAYSKSHSFNTNDNLFKNNNFSFETITQFLQQGESIPKMLIKIQLGETFATISKILEKIEILDQKIGQDETLANISSEDLNYLLSKTLEPVAQDLINFVSKNRSDADNVLPEAMAILNNPNWEEKQKNVDIVDRYFSKFKVSALFNNLMSPEDLEKRENQSELIEYSQVLGTLHYLDYFIKLAEELLKTAKNVG